MDIDAEIKKYSEYSPWVWTMANVMLPMDRKWSFAERQWQIDIFEDNHREIVSKKSAQVGETTVFICKALWFMEHYKVRVIWTFPRRDDVGEFVQTRFNPILNSSPNLSGKVGRDKDDPQNIRILKFNDSFIYFQESSVDPRQTPADMVVNDEVDRSNTQFLDAYVGRLEDSDWKYHYRFSTPTIPNFGIDAIFNNESDMRYWMVKCSHCNHFQSLIWDKNLMFDAEGLPYYGCEKCRGVLNPDVILNGEFVPMKPSRSVHGYQITGMMMPLSKTPAFMYNRFRSMTKRKNFYNLLLGETYESEGMSFDSETILSNVYRADEEPYPHRNRAAGSTYMGVDQKGDIHVVIAEMVPGSDNEHPVLRIIHAEVIPRKQGEDSWRRLGKLMDWFKIRFCVHDALPNQHNAEEFRNTFRGKVGLKFDSVAKQGLYTFNEKDGRILLDRTQSFDGFLDDIQSGLWRFWGTRGNMSPVLKEMVAHCSNMKRDEEERKNKSGGTTTYGVWRRTGTDDFAHAWAYCRLAAIIRPATQLQVQLIGGQQEDEDIEYEESKIWPGLMIPKKKKKSDVVLG
jgi:hypothetical protein